MESTGQWRRRNDLSLRHWMFVAHTVTVDNNVIFICWRIWQMWNGTSDRFEMLPGSPKDYSSFYNRGTFVLNDD